MEKIKVAIIGCGTIAKLCHIPAYIANPNCEIKYFCDIIPERAQAMVDEHSTGTAITDYNEILGDLEVEAVSVCTHNDSHMKISVDFLKSGKNVLCEKPAARIYTQALEMQKACHESGKILAIGVVNRFSSTVNRIKKMIDNGELGDIYHVYASFRAGRSIPGLGGDFTTKDKAGGGVLIDWGVHYLDLIMYCIGNPKPKTVSGQAYCKLGKDMEKYTYIDMWAGPPDYNGIYDVEDFVTGMIRTEGPTITINGAWAQNIFINEMYVDFLGTKAGLRLNYSDSNFKVFSTKDGALTETEFKFNKNDMFREEIDSFINSVKTGEKLPSHIDNNIVVSQIMQALYDSSDMGNEITLN